MFSLTRLPVRQMFLLFHKDISYIQIPPLVWCVMPRNPPERAVTTTQTKIPNYIHNVHRNMSNVFYNQSSGCFSNIYSIILIIDNISTGTVGFSLGPGVTMVAFLFCAQLTQSPHLSTYAMWSFTLILQNKSLKLCLKTIRKRNLVDIPLNGAMGGYGRWSFQNRSHFLV